MRVYPERTKRCGGSGLVSRLGISHQKLEFFDLNGCESASEGPSVPLLRVENSDLHGNSIEPTSKSVSPGPRGHDLVIMQISVFDSYQRDWKCLRSLIHNRL